MARAIAVVTGASGGIGAAIARTIARRSEGELRLALHYNDNRAAVESLAAEIPESLVIGADLATSSGRQHLLDTVLRAGSPYVLVNNAGTSEPHQPALGIQEHSFDFLVNINLKAPLFLMQSFAREMGRLDGGVIVNISSILAHRALVGSAVYGATKAALEALTRQFAMELGGHGVRVAAVAPGLIATAMTDLISEELQQKLRGQIASGELGKPEHIAEAVWHLIENEYTTGAVLAVDGGLGL